jgi:signal peptidase I
MDFMEIFKKIYNFALDTMQTILLAASIFLIVYIFLFRPFQVSGESMDPTYKNKEYILTSLIALKFDDPKKGDVIVFNSPTDPDKDFIKRVMATAGDTIYLREGFVYVNNKKLDESEYLTDKVRTYGGNFMKEDVSVTVPEGNFIVMGDNRPLSSDSREWGFLPREKIIGDSLFVYWPITDMRLIKNPFGQ